MSDEQTNQENMDTQEQTGGGDANGDNVENDDDRKLFVGGLSWETTEVELKQYMETFGKVEKCNLKKDLETGRSRGFGFVVFEDVDSIEKVLGKSEHKLQGKTIDPKRANPKGKFQEQPIKKIYVAKVSPTTTEEQIKEYFEQWGKVEKIETPYDKEKDQRRNFVFVEFDSEEAVNKVLNHSVENTDFKHKLGSDEIEIKKATPSRGGRGGRGFFRGGDRGRGGRGGYGGGYGYGGGWNDGYSQGYSGYGGYGNGYGGYGGGYGNYSYDPNYNYGGYGGGWGGYDQGYYGYSGGYDYSGGWGGYGDQSGNMGGGGGYGKAPKNTRGGAGGGYRPY